MYRIIYSPASRGPGFQQTMESSQDLDRIKSPNHLLTVADDIMVLILDGSSDYGALICSKLGISIC